MIPSSIWDTIESSRFTAEIGVVSTPRSFVAAIEKHAIIIELLSKLNESSCRQDVFKRLIFLLDKPADRRYCHPNDLAMAIYLRVLEISDPQLAIDAADLTLATPSLWWARSIAQHIVSVPERRVPVERFQVRIGSDELQFVRTERATSSPQLFTVLVWRPPKIKADFRAITKSSDNPKVFLFRKKISYLQTSGANP
jgi:hypothetical protein